MTRNELYDLERRAYKEVEALKKETHVKTEAYCEGLEKGWDMMFKAVRGALAKEEEKAIAERSKNGNL